MPTDRPIDEQLPTADLRQSTLDDDADQIDLVEVVAVFWRRRWLIVGVFAVILGLAVVFCLNATPNYEIIAQIRPGITGLNKNGAPVRDYTAKDIQT